MNKNDERVSPEPRTNDVDESRRKFLEKAGKLAVYTPPAVMVLMKPSHAQIANSVRVCDFDCTSNAEIKPE